MTKSLGGSVDLLADAMRKVFTETTKRSADPSPTKATALWAETSDVKGCLDRKRREHGKQDSTRGS